jgi:hypothetical protein
MSTLTPGGLMKNLAKTGSGFDGVINGTPAFVPPLIRAKRTKAMSFGGVNEYLSLANPLSGVSSFTIILWDKHNAAGTMWSRAGAVGTLVSIDGTLILYAQVGSTGIYKPSPLSLLVNGNSYMYVITKDSAHLTTMYIDGKYLWKATTAAMPVDANCYIGQNSAAGARYNGVLDNMMFYNVALDASQVNALYKSSIPR